MAAEIVTQDRFEFETTPRSTAIVIAEQARVAAQARYLIAMQRPRDISDVRVRLLNECKRPGFAEIARYAKPVGDKKIIGPSIRFAEAAMRILGNLMVESTTIHDDDKKRIVRVTVTDLETNTTLPKDLVIQKCVERKRVREGQQILGQRISETGSVVFLVESTEDDLINKENALISKAIRNGVLRLLPRDIQDECMEQVIKTLSDKAAGDPAAELKKITDAFARFNVMPSDLAVYLGHEIGQSSPAEIADLRTIWTAIEDGEATWTQIIQLRGGEKEAQPQHQQRGAQAIVEELKKRRTTGECPPPEPKQEPPPPPLALPPPDLTALRTEVMQLLSAKHKSDGARDSYLRRMTGKESVDELSFDWLIKIKEELTPPPAIPGMEFSRTR